MPEIKITAAASVLHAYKAGNPLLLDANRTFELVFDAGDMIGAIYDGPLSKFFPEWEVDDVWIENVR